MLNMNISKDSLNAVLTSEEMWVPPDYPDIDDAHWQNVFWQVNEQQKRSIANLWCWCFNVQTAGKDAEAKLEILNEHVAWLRTIKTYVAHEHFILNSPYNVCREYVLQEEGIVFHAKGPLVSNMDQLWFGTDGERLAVMKEIKFYTESWEFRNKGRYQGLSHPILEIMLHNVWDCMNTATGVSEEHLRAAALFTIGVAFNNVAPIAINDERAQALHQVAYSVFHRQRKVDTYGNDRWETAPAIIKALPLSVALDSMALLIDKELHNVGGDDELLPAQSTLSPNVVNRSHAYEVLALWIPQLSHYWETARALGLPMRDAVKDACSKLDEYDHLPQDFAM